MPCPPICPTSLLVDRPLSVRGPASHKDTAFRKPGKGRQDTLGDFGR